MSEQFHKDIHRDSFKLRCLLTNQCNNNCFYCLNDFQQKHPEEYIDGAMLHAVAQRYVEFCKLYDLKSEIYFSGGEPSVHPGFQSITERIALLNPDKFVCCSNGKNLSVYPGTYQKFTELHISIHDPVIHLGYFNAVAQQIVKNVATASGGNSRLKELVISAVFNPEADSTQFYSQNNLCGLNGEMLENLHDVAEDNENSAKSMLKAVGIDLHFKLWAMYQRRNDEAYMSMYRNFINSHKWILNRGQDFTPHNRGPLCHGCTKDCVTLKALWLFPNNTASGCPQHTKATVYNLANVGENYLNYMLFEVYRAHQCTGTGERS